MEKENAALKDLISGAHFVETTVEISIEKPTFWQKVKKQKLKKYKVKALTLHDLLKISEITLEMPDLDESAIDKLNSPAEYYRYIAQNGRNIAKILGIFLKEKEDYILKNFTNSDLRDVFLLMTKLANIESFFLCTSLAKQKLSLTKT